MAKVNPLLLNEKSETVLRCLHRIRSKQPKTIDLLRQDIDAQDIIVLNLERCVRSCVDIASHIIAYTPLTAAPTMADSFVSLQTAGIISQVLSQRLVKSVGLRNVLVHQYRAIDWEIVWAVLEHHLDDIKDFVDVIQIWNNEPA